MNRIDYDMYKAQFDTEYLRLSEKEKANRYMISQAIRLKMDKWCRKTFSVKYDINKENRTFKGHMTERFNQALDEVCEDKSCL